MNNSNIKSAKQILQDLGFNNDSPKSTQVAFLKNLIRSAYNVEVEVKGSKASKESRLEVKDFMKHKVEKKIDQLDLFSTDDEDLDKKAS